MMNEKQTGTEAVKLYTEFGYPALDKGGFDKKLVGYFQADTGTINQLVHLWKFDDEPARLDTRIKAKLF